MKLSLLALFTLLVGCGSTEFATVQYKPPQSCTITKVNGVSTETCPDGTSVTVADGAQGPAGVNGTNGTNGNNGAQGTPGATGPKGNTGAAGATGSAGQNGTNGTNGSNGNGFQSGLQCDVYSVSATDENGTVNWFSLFTNGTIKFATTIANFNVANQSSNNIFGSFTAAQQALIGNTNYAVDCHGYLNTPVSGNYTFSLGSDDGSELVIDEQPVINMPNLQAFASKNATVPLYSGLHTFNVFYFQGPATMIGLTLSWQGPSNAGLGTMTVVPASYFQH